MLASDLEKLIKNELAMLDKPLPAYEIDSYMTRSGEKWFIRKPDRSKVNDWDFPTLEKAERHLGILVAHKFCVKKENGEKL